MRPAKRLPYLAMLRARGVVAWLTVAVALGSLVGLPALHALVHEREEAAAAAAVAAAERRARFERLEELFAFIDARDGRPRAEERHGDGHGHGHGEDGDGHGHGRGEDGHGHGHQHEGDEGSSPFEHGRSSAEHLGAALVASAPMPVVLPPTVAIAPPAPLPLTSNEPEGWRRPRATRGPPERRSVA